MRYLVIFEQGDMNYSAYVPDLPVCVAVGDTLKETRKEIADAMKFHIECLQEDGEIIPSPLQNCLIIHLQMLQQNSLRLK
ncbi:MAG: type II toxin-antitoxin system HicB family antitoxin [Candidatus Poribacteria bacterium]|nr:type II toxin-antitoxin system HicB family antitoxin [Candidatus Poribacteria bacterium]